MIAVRIILWLIILGVLASPIVAWYGLDHTPLVTKSPTIDLGDVRAAKDFLDQYDPRNLPDGKVTTITADQRQINAALVTALSAAPMLKARVVPSQFGLLGAITGEMPLPENPFGRYVNIRILVESSTEGLKIGRLVVGDIEIPTLIVRPVFMLVMDQLAGPGRGRAFLETIRSVQVAGDRISVVYLPRDGLIDDLKGAAKTAMKAGDPELTKIYWAKVNDLNDSLPSGEQMSLTRFLQPVFALASERSEAGNPADENKAAILALAMFFGDVRVERFIGTVREGSYAGLPERGSRVRLQGRHDWVQHLLLSAALQLIGGRGIADFIGEIKEVGDTDKASGFSFTDLAADRTGVRFAEVAIEDPRNVQRILSGPLAEADMFPRVDGFPDSLTEQEFSARYGGLDTPEYNRVIEEMDRRIASIPLYR